MRKSILIVAGLLAGLFLSGISSRLAAQSGNRAGAPVVTNDGSSTPPRLLGRMRSATGASAAAPAPERDETPREPLPPRPGSGRVGLVDGQLPNTAGQIWREYDLRPYTSRVANVERPEQAVIDWILRETGTDVWFGDPLGILSADRETLRVYHTPEMHALIAPVVDRFVGSQAEAFSLAVRLATVGSPSWRAKAYPLLKPVTVQSPGVEAWLISKENAAFLLADLARRVDFREHNSPNLMIQNGQSHSISRTRPKSYVRSVRVRDGVIPGLETDSVELEEGYLLQISPLFALDRKSVDAVIRCQIDQVEKLIPVPIELPGYGNQKQRAQVQVPQIVSWRLHERFRWPTDQVLLLSCGVVATPVPESNGAAGIVSALTTTTGRADALLFIDCLGRAPDVPREADRGISTSSRYRGRY
ncbi:MAG: hypothetical protein FJ295_19930 [Planctomycetes bacterium]|nr:hypothetical protein [Planctomycetota bacterium]